MSTGLLKNRQCGIDVLTTRIVQGSPANCKLNFFGHFLRPSHKERGLACCPSRLLPDMATLLSGEGLRVSIRGARRCCNGFRQRKDKNLRWKSQHGE